MKDLDRLAVHALDAAQGSEERRAALILAVVEELRAIRTAVARIERAMFPNEKGTAHGS